MDAEYSSGGHSVCGVGEVSSSSEVEECADNEACAQDTEHKGGEDETDAFNIVA